ncbi:Ldh family oxidoreductase [Hoeflea poritis]|uniref:Ldh family oxidoreductase n=1 Tax=Hoeflea poritis TaxID=2993659 RepID=A0ABT4VV48_9HYPH|nr:Ldh family oxidoreductase [Hoeflea poritis]MDA4847853.1 Ldh family oxidoreductase [Hoeflea poritis]
MTDDVNLSIAELRTIAATALVRFGAEKTNAEYVAEAICHAESRGIRECGVPHLIDFCGHLQSGRVDGTVRPSVQQVAPAVVHAHANGGFAQPAFAAGFPIASAKAFELGCAVLVVSNSHTCGELGFFTKQFASAGLVSLGFTNGTALVAPPEGARPVLGTNPIAFTVPGRDGEPRIHIDQSTSIVNRAIIARTEQMESVLMPGWAKDRFGQPTQDPREALNGSILSAGGARGFCLAIVAEVLSAMVTGSRLSINTQLLKAPEGKPHHLGQFFLVLDPGIIGQSEFWTSLEVFCDAVESQAKCRLPGSGKADIAEITLPDKLWQTCLGLLSG